MHASLDQLVSTLEQLHQQKTRVVAAIDGRGGAGKSSLARSLVARLPKSAHIEHDWFHLPQSQVTTTRRFDHERLVADIIIPFRSGKSVLTCLRYNWGYLAGVPDGFHEEPVIIAEKEILIVEGCETLHPVLARHFDLRIWLDTPPEVALERGIRRDIDEYKLEPENVHAAWREWSVWEAESLACDDRSARADVVL